jgi:hypothetical protein
MKETVFQSEIVDSLKSLGVWGYKIPDIPFNYQNKFCPKKPCDILCVPKNYPTIYIEAKMIKEWKSFGIKMLEESQVEAGKILTSLGHKYFIFLNVRLKADPFKESKQESRCIIFSYQEIMSRGENFYAKELKNMPFIPGHKGLFDLSSFLSETTLEF